MRRSFEQDVTTKDNLFDPRQEAQSKVNNYAAQLAKNLKEHYQDWDSAGKALDGLKKIRLNLVERNGPVLESLEQVLYSSLHLPGPFKLELYKLIDAYAHSYWYEKRLMLEQARTTWEARIEELIVWTERERHEDDAPYLNAYAYHLYCAKAVIQLIPDTHETNWPGHVASILSVIGACLGICESDGGQLADNFFTWLKQRYYDRQTRNWYEQVLMLRGFQSKLPNQEFCLLIQRHLRKEMKKKMWDWQVVYACIEALEHGINVSKDRESLEFILEGGNDPHDNSKLDGLWKLQDYERFYGDDWRIRARIVSLAMGLTKHSDRKIAEKAESVLVFRKVREPDDSRVQLVLKNPPQDFKHLLAVLAASWVREKPKVERLIEEQTQKIQQLEDIIRRKGQQPDHEDIKMQRDRLEHELSLLKAGIPNFKTEIEDGLERQRRLIQSLSQKIDEEVSLAKEEREELRRERENSLAIQQDLQSGLDALRQDMPALLEKLTNLLTAVERIGVNIELLLVGQTFTNEALVRVEKMLRSILSNQKLQAAEIDELTKLQRTSIEQRNPNSSSLSTDQAHFSDITFEEKVGEDSFGRIYQAEWQGQLVTVRRFEGTITPHELAGFLNEVDKIRLLKSPFITEFKAACVETDCLCLLTEYMQEGDLECSLSTLTFSERLQMALDLAKGLQYLHQQNLLHGDIQPKHILVNEYKAGKWSHVCQSQNTFSSSRRIKMECTGIRWRAPELSRIENMPSQASEVYSFGMVLWTLFTKEVPFLGMAESDIIEAVNAGHQERLEALPLDLPEPCRRLIGCCLLTDPGLRPSLDDLVKGFGQAILENSRTVVLRPDSPIGEKLHQQGKIAYESGDLVKARGCYEEAAARGNIKSRRRLGFFALERVAGVEVARAQPLLEEAANAGDLTALYNLARMYEKGDCVSKNERHALSLYERLLSLATDQTVRRDAESKIMRIRSEHHLQESTGYKLSTKF